MNPSTYWGDHVGILRPYYTKDNIALAQDEATGDCAAVCGTCFHLLHSKGTYWYCSDVACGKEYKHAQQFHSSMFRGHSFVGTEGIKRFKYWVAAWSKIEAEDLTILLEWH